VRLSKKIRAKYGSLKQFCELNGLNYGSFRAQLGVKRVYGKYKEALLKKGIVKNDAELAKLLEQK